MRQSHGQPPITEPEYDLLIIVANWPSARSLAWRTLLQARAIENQCYVAGVNRTGSDGKGLLYAGESMILGPLGEPIKIFGAEEEIFSHTLNREKLEEIRLKFPFWRDADGFFIQS
jgi:predicted amidohydrolase